MIGTETIFLSAFQLEIFEEFSCSSRFSSTKRDLYNHFDRTRSFGLDHQLTDCVCILLQYLQVEFVTSIHLAFLESPHCTRF